MNISLNGLFKQPWLLTLAPLTCCSQGSGKGWANSLRLIGPDGLCRTTSLTFCASWPRPKSGPRAPTSGASGATHTSTFIHLASAVLNPVGHCAALLLLIRSGNGAWTQKANTCNGIPGEPPWPAALWQTWGVRASKVTESWICLEPTGLFTWIIQPCKDTLTFQKPSWPIRFTVWFNLWVPNSLFHLVLIEQQSIRPALAHSPWPSWF